MSPGTSTGVRQCGGMQWVHNSGTVSLPLLSPPLSCPPLLKPAQLRLSGKQCLPTCAPSAPGAARGKGPALPHGAAVVFPDPGVNTAVRGSHSRLPNPPQETNRSPVPALQSPRGFAQLLGTPLSGDGRGPLGCGRGLEKRRGKYYSRAPGQPRLRLWSPVPGVAVVGVLLPPPTLGPGGAQPPRGKHTPLELLHHLQTQML